MRMFVWVGIAIVFTVAPFMVGSLGAALGTGGQLLVSGFGATMLVGGITVVTITRLYVRAAANEAFVKTGMGGTKVILDGGALIIPVVHELVKVPLTTMRLDVDRSGPDSLITADKLRADLKAEFYIRVLPQSEDIQNAARSLGNLADDPQRIANLVNDKLISALRSVAANKTLEELNTRRNEFAGEVKQQVEPDLKHNGLTLETVTISKLDQTDPKNLKADNVFDAQGLKRITEITTDAAVRRNELEQDAQKMMKERNVQTKLEILLLERQQAEAEAGQSSEIAKVKALREAEARQAQIEQEQAVAAREVEKTRALKAADLEAQQKVLESERQRELVEVAKSNAIEMAMIEAEKKVKEAERQRELTEVEKQKAIETANQEKALAVALAQAKRAEAEQEQYAKLAMREKAAQDVETVKVTSAAEREGDQKLIAASKAAQQELVREQRKADATAYTIQKEAEAKKAAAQAEYEARLKAAEAESEAAKKRAEGLQAEQMVAVNVQQRLVEVEQQKVDVESKRLEMQEKFGKAAIELQVRLKQIEVSGQVEIERARAMGSMLSRGDFTIYGDPETFGRMAEAFSKGMQMRQNVEGFLANKGLDDNLGKVVSAAADVLGKAVGKKKE
ncbi:MAG: hypothetical protein HYY25_15795 [Candidatus Wallbacteria bacterium]|nr:hypothetical protein [Candidatus Wallbacteria bacterium]